MSEEGRRYHLFIPQTINLNLFFNSARDASTAFVRALKIRKVIQIAWNLLFRNDYANEFIILIAVNPKERKKICCREILEREYQKN